MPTFVRTIEIDNTAGTTQTDWQQRVDLDAANFDFSKADSEGESFRFLDASGNHLSFWREYFDPVAQAARFWVKVPTLGVSGLTEIKMHFGVGDGSYVDRSDGKKTFVEFDDFLSDVKRLLPYGTDSGFSSGFDPVSRRFYNFGSDVSSGVGVRAVQWVHVDTGEVGFVFPGAGAYTAVHSSGIVYHPVKQKFYLYGGRNVGSGGRVNIIQTFDPATRTYPKTSKGLF